jgi:hypothetical protein
VGLGPEEARSFPEKSRVQLPSARRPLPNGKPGWNDFAAPICYEVPGALARPLCGKTVFDSGGSRSNFSNGRIPRRWRDKFWLKPGTRLRAYVDGGFSWSTSVGRRDFTVFEPAKIGKYDFILGIQFFKDNDVLFDLEHGRIGIRPY